MKSQALPLRMVIQGITRNGETFRPSDWTERLQDCIATHGIQKSSRLHHSMSVAGIQRKASFSPHVYVSFRSGIKSLVVERELWEKNVAAYEFIVNFAQDNELTVIEEWMEEELRKAA
ncbi:conserved hypothetical protein [Gammaproteobacteria bacterium]